MKTSYRVEERWVPSEDFEDWTLFGGSDDISTLKEARASVRVRHESWQAHGCSSQLFTRIVKVTEKVVR